MNRDIDTFIKLWIPYQVRNDGNNLKTLAQAPGLWHMNLQACHSGAGPVFQREESGMCGMPDSWEKTAWFGHWVPALAGMKGITRRICDLYWPQDNRVLISAVQLVSVTMQDPPVCS